MEKQLERKYYETARKQKMYLLLFKVQSQSLTAHGFALT